MKNKFTCETEYGQTHEMIIDAKDIEAAKNEARRIANTKLVIEKIVSSETGEIVFNRKTREEE